MQIQFATNSYKSASLPLSAQQCINLYAEKEPQDAKASVALFYAPGLTTFATCGVGPVRGMRVMNDVLYVVSGDTLYSVSQTGVVTELGGAISSSGPVSMSDNGTQLCMVNGENGYIWSQNGGFQIISSVNLHAARTVTFFDNVFVFDWMGTNKVFISDTLDGVSYSGLGFGTAEVSSDFVLSVVNQAQTLLLFGQTTIESWYDAGTVNMPFQRIDGGTIERGCGAALTPIKEDNSVFFLGNDRLFYRLNQITPIRVSTHAIENEWQQYATVSDAYTFVYTYDGHKFINIVFPSVNKTWSYDISTGLWQQRESWDINNRPYGRWRGNCSVVAYGNTYIGDYYSGQIGMIDGTTYTEFGNTMQGLATSPPYHKDRRRMFVSRLELDVETGVGLNTGQGSDPQIMMQWSRDGGRTYSDLQLWHTMGKIGAYLTRVRWLRLGQARQWVFRITVSDPVKRVVMGAYADAGPGM